ncbi:MAG: ABC transporter permease subunit, partial [Myxococcota bacterium]
VAALLDEPLLALWCGVALMVLLPLVLLFSSAGSIASEVKSRSVRYLLCRTGRLEIGLGKLAGQLLIAIVAAALGGATAWAMVMTLMVGNPPVGLAVALAERTFRAVLWALPFAGLGLMASQWVASPNGARVIAGGLFLAMPTAGWFLGLRADLDVVGRLCDFAGMFVATKAWPDFWSPEPDVLGAAVLRGVVLAVVYYAAGHVVFARRDL